MDSLRLLNFSSGWVPDLQKDDSHTANTCSENQEAQEGNLGERSAEGSAPNVNGSNENGSRCLGSKNGSKDCHVGWSGYSLISPSLNTWHWPKIAQDGDSHAESPFKGFCKSCPGLVALEGKDAERERC